MNEFFIHYNCKFNLFNKLLIYKYAYRPSSINEINPYILLSRPSENSGDCISYPRRRCSSLDNDPRLLYVEIRSFDEDNPSFGHGEI